MSTPNKPAPDGDILPQLMFQALEGLEFGIVVFGAEGDERPVLYVNSAFQRITGFKAEESVGRNCRFLARGDGDLSGLEKLRRAMAERRPCRVDLVGGRGWVRFSLSPIRDEAGVASHMLGLVEDITATRRTLAQLEQSESQLRTIMVSVEEGIQLWNAQGGLIYSNPASVRQFGTLADGVEQGGRQHFDTEGLPLHDEDFPVRRVLLTGKPEKDVLMRVVQPDGGQSWVRMNAHPILDQETGKLLGAVTSTSDVTRTVEQELRLQRLAHYDALTQLPNRVLLADRMQQALARHQRNREPFAVGLMDLDGFKPVNDTYGHKAGDQILKEVAERLTASIREGDTVARLGGDEFALLLSGFATTLDCESVLHRILNTISQPYTVDGNMVRISTSIGITLYPDDRVDPDKLLRHADQAMYLAKQEGKNRFKFFDSALERRSQANQGALQKIHKALEAGQFELHYQPVVDCRQGRLVGAEALIRWRHPVLGLLGPAEFLPLIEQNELIDALGEWVLTAALAQAQRWQAEGLELDISVNVSAHQLHQPGFAERLRVLMAEAGPAAARHLNLEIVETAALEDISQMSELTAKLREAGVRIALDDFGTGHSSLIHLRRLAVDTLKIDQTFVQGMLDDPLDLAIVEGVIGLASAFQLRVVGEGVESGDHVLMLLELGCDLMQGFAIGRPMVASDFDAWRKTFDPDPLWLEAGSARPRHGDIQLMLAEANHRHWVERVIACTHAHSTGDMPPLDYRQCRFGQWYYGEGMQRYGGQRDYLVLGGVHREVHELAAQLCNLIDSGRENEVVALRDQLNARRERLLDQLENMRWAQAGRRSGTHSLIAGRGRR